jgi:hypothetical protein
MNFLGAEVGDLQWKDMYPWRPRCFWRFVFWILVGPGDDLGAIQVLSVWLSLSVWFYVVCFIHLHVELWCVFLLGVSSSSVLTLGFQVL